VPYRFGRPSNREQPLRSFVDEAGRLRAFVPPFRFTSFFSPEDTLLCVCASEAALVHARIPGSSGSSSRRPLRIAELTTGSGLAGLHLLRIEKGSTLLGFDVDPVAVATSRRNARTLGLHSRARFECKDLWSDSMPDLLRRFDPQLIVCNPPYVPEPDVRKLELEAGSGEDGTAHLMRTLELVDVVRPSALALSWCSLSDPARIVREAESIGYFLNSLFVVLIADGEYSGSVHEHLLTLQHAYISESDETREAVAPDGSARFGYLLIAGDFSRAENTATRKKGCDASIERICTEFSEHGIGALVNPIAPVPVRTWILDRWDELRLRASLHGEVQKLTATGT
jgi:methylase of polypeptide subunit release factors